MAATGMNWDYKFNRLSPEGLDPSQLKATKAEAEAYLSTSIAYEGQTLYVKEEKKFYGVIKDTEGNLILDDGAFGGGNIDGGEF